MQQGLSPSARNSPSSAGPADTTIIDSGAGAPSLSESAATAEAAAWEKRSAPPLPGTLRRAAGYLRYRPAAVGVALVGSLLSGVLFLALMLILGLVLDLLITQGRVEFTSDEVPALSRLAPYPDRAVSESRPGLYENRGLLPLVYRSRGSFLVGPLLKSLYQRRWLQSNLSAFMGLVLVAVLVGFLRSALEYVRRWAAASAAVEAVTQFRRAIHRQTYRLGATALPARGPAPAVNLFTRDAEALEDGLYALVGTVAAAAVTAASMLLLAVLIHPGLALVFMILAVLIVFIVGRLAERWASRARAATREAAGELSLLQETLYLIRLVRGYLMETLEGQRFERHLERYGQNSVRRIRNEALLVPTIELFALVALAVIFTLAGYNLLAIRPPRLALSSSLLLYAAVASLVLPGLALWRVRATLRTARQAAASIFAFLDQPAVVGQVVGAAFLPPMSKGLVFDHVSLDDDAGRAILNDVSFRIQSGQRVALVGRGLEERHAVAYLVPRFLEQDRGEIRIDGQNTRFATLESLRVQTALVMEQELVFTAMVRDNIGCGEPSYTLQHIIDAAKAAHAHQFIQRLSAGYETMIGDEGVELSTSEKFRIALARAILRDPALVIIEEPADALDDATKALLDDTYARFLRDRTAIFLPRRLSTLRFCDQVLLFDQGRLADSGTHRSLVESNDLYRHLIYTRFSLPAALGSES